MADKPAQRLGTRATMTYGTVAVALGTATAQALTALALLLLARRLTPADFGRFSAAYAFATFVGAGVDFGSSQVATRRLAAGEPGFDFRGWWRSRTRLSLLALPPTLVALRFAWGDRLSNLTVLAFGVQAVGSCAAIGVIAGVRALRSPVLSGWLVAVGNVLFVATAVMPSTSLVVWAAWGSAISWLATVALAAALIPRRSRIPSRRPRQNPWAGATSFGVFALASAAPLLAIPVLGIVAGDSEAGQFAAVNRWVQPLLLIPLSYSAFMYPRFSRAQSDQEVVQALRQGAPIAAGAVAIATAAIIGSSFAVHTLLGSAYAGATLTLQILLASSIPILAAQPLATALQARSDEKFVAQVAVVGAVVMLLGTALLATPIGARGAALSFLISNIFVLIAQIARWRQRGRSKPHGQRFDLG